MSAEAAALEAATIRQQCKVLRHANHRGAVRATGRTGGA